MATRALVPDTVRVSVISHESLPLTAASMLYRGVTEEILMRSSA